MMNQPKGWHSLALCILGAAFYALWNSVDWSTAGKDFLAIVSLTFWGFGIAAFLRIALDALVDIYENFKRASHISTRAVELERAARLTDEQARAVPAMTYEQMMGYHLKPGEEWVAYLITKDGHIPFEWTQKFLLECTSTKLRPIRSYVNGSQAQHYAQWFTAWLRDRGYVVGGTEESGKVAEWLDHATYFKVRKLFRLELEDYEESPTDSVEPEQQSHLNQPAVVTGD